MNGTRLIFGIVTGTTFTGIMLALAGYFITINSTDGGLLGPEKNWWIIAVVTDLGVGILIGGVSGAVIVGFNLSSIKAVLFCGMLNLLIVAGFYFVTNGGMSEGIRDSLYALIPIGLLNGIAVSLFSSTPQTLR